MTKKKIWRLSEKPSPENLRGLVADGILTKEEAKEFLFNEETEQERDVESFKSEIKFLRELVEKLSKNSPQIIETIRYIEKPYYRYPWWGYYATWCGTTNSSSGMNTLTSTSGTTYLANSNSGDTFSAISTF